MAVPIPLFATFAANFPEYAGFQALAEAKLAEAASRTSVRLGSQSEYACMLLAAILLWKSPYAREIRKVTPELEPAWRKELTEIRAAKVCGLRVFCG